MNKGSNREADAEAVETQGVGANGFGPAHHLRNLVQVVSGYMELLAVRTQDELSLRYIESAQSAAQEITNLAQSLSGDPDARQPPSLDG